MAKVILWFSSLDMDHDSPKCVSLTGTFSHRDMVDLVISFGTLGCKEFVDVQIATRF